MTIKQNSSDH